MISKMFIQNSNQKNDEQACCEHEKEQGLDGQEKEKEEKLFVAKNEKDVEYSQINIGTSILSVNKLEVEDQPTNDNPFFYQLNDTSIEDPTEDNQMKSNNLPKLNLDSLKPDLEAERDLKPFKSQTYSSTPKQMTSFDAGNLL